MPELYETIGQVVKGRLDLHPEAIRGLNAAIRPWEGKQVRMTVRLGRGRRSDRQNRYMWGVCYALLAEATGHSAEDLHEYFKAKFLPKELAFADANGEIVDSYVIGGSTTRLSTTEFEDYVAKIRLWALDMPRPIVIPEPNEV